MDTERETALKQCISENLPMLRAAAYRIVGNTADADEAIQLALLAAWRKFDSFRGESRLSSWIYRITINEAYNIVRKTRRYERNLARYAQCPQPEECLEESLATLENAIEKLPPLYRDAIHVGVLSGLDGALAAEQLECTPNTLYQRIFKAKSLLRNLMQEVQNEP